MMTARSDVEQQKQQKHLFRLSVAACIGTTVEWYDFFIYSTAAALIFSHSYFPEVSPAAQTLAALSTIAVGYFARPLGALVFGHFGDKMGRRDALLISLILMGIGTFLTGLVPSYDSIGIWAAIFLVILRFIQGVALGGEWGGAVVMMIEHAPGRKRGLYGSIVQVGAPLGFILAVGAFLIITSVSSDEWFSTWGWRIPFLVSILLVGVGLYMRLRISETPVFQEAQKQQKIAQLPIVEVFRTHFKEVLLGIGIGAAQGTPYIVYTAYAMAYGTGQVGISKSTILTAILIASTVTAIIVPIAGKLSDRFGRRTVTFVGLLSVALWAYPSFILIDMGTLTSVTIAVSVAIGSVGIALGPESALYAELFNTRVRYTGTGITYMLNGVVGAGLAAIVAPALFLWTGTVLSVVAYVVFTSVIGMLCVLLVRETHKIDLDQSAIPDGMTPGAVASKVGAAS